MIVAEKESDIIEIDYFTRLAKSACEECGRVYIFKCPICHKDAAAIKNWHGHVWGVCQHCQTMIIE